jgi:hypothetical protein
VSNSSFWVRNSPQGNICSRSSHSSAARQSPLAPPSVPLRRRSLSTVTPTVRRRCPLSASCCHRRAPRSVRTASLANHGVTSHRTRRHVPNPQHARADDTDDTLTTQHVGYLSRHSRPGAVHS